LVKLDADFQRLAKYINRRTCAEKIIIRNQFFMSESLISGFFDPPIIFRGGDAFPRKPLDQKIAEILDSLSPMGWLTGVFRITLIIPHC
jgi:hypothetical protein